MNISDLDNSFNKKYFTLRSGEILASGDIISFFNKSAIEKNNWIYDCTIDSVGCFLFFKIIEYFNVNKSGIFPFFHEPNGYAFNKWTMTSFNFGMLHEMDKSQNKVNLNDLQKIKLNIQCYSSNLIFSLLGHKNLTSINNKNGYYLINFKDTIYYKNILKILRGIKHRNEWIAKYGEFPYIFILANGKEKNLLKFDKSKNELLLSLNDFYKTSNINDPNRNLEIFCKIKSNLKHKEYFFKFKKEKKQCEEYCWPAEQAQDCIH